MFNKYIKPNEFTRRQALSTLLAGAALPMSMKTAHAMTDVGFEKTVAQYVRDLTKGEHHQLRMLFPEGAGANLTQIVKQFKDMTGVDVLLEEVPVSSINTELTLDALMGTQRFDLALPTTYGMPDLVAADALLRLTPFVIKYEPYDFRESLLYSTGDSFDGIPYGFQTDGAVYLMFYNKTMFENIDDNKRFEDTYGTQLSIPETWQDLDRQIKFFNRPEKYQWGGSLFRTPNYLAWEWWVRFHAKGTWPFASDMTPLIASDSGVQALEEMIKVTEYLHPDVMHLGLFDNWDLYAQGNIYCNIGGGGTQKYLNRPDSTMQNNMLFSSTPGGMIDGELMTTPYFNWGWDYVVVKKSKQPELAYLFALFASTPAMSTLLVGQPDGFFDPFRPEHYKDPQTISVYSESFLTAHRDALENAIPDLYLERQGDYFHALTVGLVSALKRETSPQDALKRVAQKWDLITDGAGRKRQVQRWASLRRKYPANVKAKLRYT